MWFFFSNFFGGVYALKVGKKISLRVNTDDNNIHHDTSLWFFRFSTVLLTFLGNKKHLNRIQHFVGRLNVRFRYVNVANRGGSKVAEWSWRSEPGHAYGKGGLSYWLCDDGGSFVHTLWTFAGKRRCSCQISPRVFPKIPSHLRWFSGKKNLRMSKALLKKRDKRVRLAEAIAVSWRKEVPQPSALLRQHLDHHLPQEERDKLISRYHPTVAQVGVQGAWPSWSPFLGQKPELSGITGVAWEALVTKPWFLTIRPRTAFGTSLSQFSWSTKELYYLLKIMRSQRSTAVGLRD